MSKKTMSAMMAAAMTAVTMGSGPSSDHTQSVQHQNLGIIRNTAPRIPGSEQKRKKRAKANAENSRYNMAKTWLARKLRIGKGAAATAYKQIQGMTNWQNHQWLKAGAPKDPAAVNHYANLTRGGSNE